MLPYGVIFSTNFRERKVVGLCIWREKINKVGVRVLMHSSNEEYECIFVRLTNFPYKSICKY